MIQEYFPWRFPENRPRPNFLVHSGLSASLIRRLFCKRPALENPQEASITGLFANQPGSFHWSSDTQLGKGLVDEQT